MARLFDYPESVVESDKSVIFCLDSDLRITYCNPAWDRFALQNGAKELCRPSPIGRCVLDSISGPDRDYFEKHYSEALRQSEPWERDYECSSADAYRRFRLRALPMQAVRGLFVINSLAVEHAPQHIGQPPLEELYRLPNGMIVMCAGCRRTRRNTSEADIWDWVPCFVQEIPAGTSHTVCPPCLQLYYSDEE